MSIPVMCRLESHALFRAAHTVLLYSSLPDEVDTHTFIRRWEGRKRILLPVVVSDSELELRVYTGSGNMRRGAFNIDEPAGAAFTDYGSIDLAVIPGVAFDRHGNRLGRGRGYYDRLLARLGRAGVPTIGVCFYFQKLDAIPAETHDIAVGEVL